MLVAVECVPPGSVVSYGDIAGLVGTGPRVVGRIMALYGAGVAWWRVTNASGKLPAHLLPAARREWGIEGIQLTGTGQGCRIVRHRADLAALATTYDAQFPPVLPGDASV